MDPKSTIAEAKIFNFLAADGFPGSCGALLPTRNGVASLPGHIYRRAWVVLLQWYLKLD